MHHLLSPSPAARAAALVVTTSIALFLHTASAATLSSGPKNSLQQHRRHQTGGAFYSRPENYPSPTAVHKRRPSADKNQNNQISELNNPIALEAAFRPDTFNGRSPFLTFNGRDSSDFLGPGSLGLGQTVVPGGAAKHFIPPTAEYLQSGSSSQASRHISAREASSRAINAPSSLGRAPRSLFFNDFDHGAIVLRYSEERQRQGMPALKLGSVRPGFPFFRHDY